MDAGALGLPISMGLRDSIWSTLGRAQDGSVWQLIMVSSGGGVLIGVLTFAISLTIVGLRR